MAFTRNVNKPLHTVAIWCQSGHKSLKYWCYVTRKGSNRTHLNWRTRAMFENKFVILFRFLYFFEKKMISRTRGAGGKYYSPANSRTNGRRGTSEAAIESSRCEDSYELLNVLKKVTCEVKVRSKVKYTCLWTIGRRDQSINISVLKLSSNASK